MMKIFLSSIKDLSRILTRGEYFEYNITYSNTHPPYICFHDE